MYTDPEDGGMDHPFLRNFNHRTYHDTEDWFNAIANVAPVDRDDVQRPLF